MMMASEFYVAFRRSSDGLYGRLIKWRTGGVYSHVELVVGPYQGVMGGAVCFSSSNLDGGVRKKQLKLNPANWDLVKVPKDHNFGLTSVRYENISTLTLGRPYDWRGALLWGLPFQGYIQQKKKWFCSEIVAYIFNFEDPHTFNPQTLYSTLTDELGWEKIDRVASPPAAPK